MGRERRGWRGGEGAGRGGGGRGGGGGGPPVKCVRVGGGAATVGGLHGGYLAVHPRFVVARTPKSEPAAEGRPGGKVRVVGWGGVGGRFTWRVFDRPAVSSLRAPKNSALRSGRPGGGVLAVGWTAAVGGLHGGCCADRPSRRCAHAKSGRLGTSRVVAGANWPVRTSGWPGRVGRGALVGHGSGGSGGSGRVFGPTRRYWPPESTDCRPSGPEAGRSARPHASSV